MAGLYIHIPFCTKRCSYCDFYSQTNLKQKKAFVQAIATEIKLQKDYLGKEPLETIYLGGGTPSLLAAKDFELIFNAITQYHDISSLKEVTLEVNPDDITPTYIADLKLFPFNRISIGVQSFDEKELLLLNRRHNRNQAINAVRLLQKAGYYNISLDLIYGIPSQTRYVWENNINEAIHLDVPHISAYHLTYEKGTSIHDQLEKGIIHAVSEDVSVFFFQILIEKLAKFEYLHYEISNFSKKGFISMHNTSYWTQKKYLGIGPSAHSYNQKTRQANIASISLYIKGVNENYLHVEKEILDKQTRYNDYILTRLRTTWGIQLNSIQKEFGEKYINYLLKEAEPHLKNKLLEIKNDCVKLTNEGIFVSDGIICDLIMLK